MYGATPLHYACYNGRKSTVLVLLQNKADPNLQTEVTSRRMIDDDSRYMVMMMMIIAVMMIDDAGSDADR
jgi:ankyrin repeat protein